MTDTCLASFLTLRLGRPGPVKPGSCGFGDVEVGESMQTALPQLPRHQIAACRRLILRPSVAGLRI